MTLRSHESRLPRRVLASLVGTALAAGVLLADAPMTLAQGGGCIDFFANNTWAGAEKDPSAWVTAVKGNHYTSGSSHFYACSLTSPGNDGPSTWVSIDPGSGSSQSNNFNAILQIGFIRCTSVAYSTCDNGVPHFFWARGGCGTAFPVPFDLDEALHGTHSYQISKNTNGVYELRADGVLRVSIGSLGAEINCWTNQDTRGTWFVERLDRGDSAGSNGTTSQRTQMTTFRYKTAGSAWMSPSIGGCINSYASGTGRYQCTSGSDWVHVWTIY